MEASFLCKLKKDRGNQKINSFCFSLTKYTKTIDKVKCAKLKTVKDPADYKLLRRYDVIDVAGVEKLIAPVKENTEIGYFVYDEELFEILSAAHSSTGHGGRDRMMKELRRKYRNITYKDVNMFLSLCEQCLQKPKREKKNIGEKPLLLQDFNYRCQVDLIDYQSHPDGDFKFILVYQDHLTNFVVLKALASKEAVEVADNLIDIFTLLGAPTVLQSDNGWEFCNSIITNLKRLWPDLKLVLGKPQHSQDSIERAYQDVENMLTTWMQDNQTSQWSKGLRFVQLMKNKTFDSGIKRTPYEAFFRKTLQLGLTTSNIPQEKLLNVQEEDELVEIINKSSTTKDYTEVIHEEFCEVMQEDIVVSSSNEIKHNSGNELSEEPIVVKNSIPEPINCVACQSDCSVNNTSCSVCQNYFHLTCGFQNSTRNVPICAACGKQGKIIEHINLPFEGLQQQPKRMKTVSPSGRKRKYSASTSPRRAQKKERCKVSFGFCS